MDRIGPTSRSLTTSVLTTSLLCIAFLAPPSALAGIDAWPLLEIDEDTTTIMYPFFVNDGDFTMIFPLYYRTNDARDHHILWPLLKFSEGKLKRLAPFYFAAQENRFTLFPLVHQTKNSTWMLVPPILLSRKDEFHAVFPLYAHDDQSTWVLPNLKFERDNVGDLARVRSFGIFDWHRSGTETELDLLWIAGYQRGGSKTHTRFLPLFSFTKSPSQSNLWVGLVNYAKGIDATGFPHSRVCVLPLFCDRKARNVRNRFIGPWYDWHSDKRRSTGVLGLFGTSREVEPDGQETRELSLLLWSYSRKTVRNAKGVLIERRRRFLLFTDHLTQQGRSFKIFGFPIREDVRTRSKNET